MVKEHLAHVISAAIQDAVVSNELAIATMPGIDVTSPAGDAGDEFVSDVALALAREAGRPPRDVAQTIAALVPLDGGLIESIEVEGAGQLRFRLKPEWPSAVMDAVLSRGADYGRSSVGDGRRVQVEFVSANPTGPLSIQHGRGAAIGDVLASLLEWNGYDVSREFYVNDAGGQIERFGRSVNARYLQLLGRDAAVPEDGYHGEYLRELAQRIRSQVDDDLAQLPDGERLERLGALGREAMLQEQKETLARFGVSFDLWYSERELHDSGQVDRVVERLRERGHTYVADGATWLRSTAFGDESDRPLRRSNGRPTYITADLAYHQSKFERGFNRVIDIWGPDHHGYVARTRGGLQALGYDPERLEILIHQNVRLYVDGELRLGSKRAGEMIPLDDLLDEVGPDIARFAYLSRPADSPLDIDLDLAKRAGPDNPAIAVRTAHARACELSDASPPSALVVGRWSFVDESDRALVRCLAEFPDVVRGAAARREPHALAQYAHDLATMVHAYCRDRHVLSEDAESTALQPRLLAACRVVLANALSILGVSAPERASEIERRDS